MNYILFWSIVLGIIAFGFYMIFPYFPTDKYPIVTEECMTHYPQNTTFEGQTIFTRPWSNKCCSVSWLPNTDSWNVCWEKEK